VFTRIFQTHETVHLDKVESLKRSFSSQGRVFKGRKKIVGFAGMAGYLSVADVLAQTAGDR
jgi:hypothetical protein